MSHRPEAMQARSNRRGGEKKKLSEKSIYEIAGRIWSCGGKGEGDLCFFFSFPTYPLRRWRGVGESNLISLVLRFLLGGCFGLFPCLICFLSWCCYLWRAYTLCRFFHSSFWSCVLALIELDGSLSFLFLYLWSS